MKEIKFESHPHGRNYILKGNGFYVSYNPDTFTSYFGRGLPPGFFTDLANFIDPSRQLKDGEETALYDGENWYILEGDFRKNYLRAFPKGLEACKRVYERNKAKRSNWSTD